MSATMEKSMSMIVRRFQELSPVIILSDQILIRYHVRSFSFWYLAMPSTEIWCRSDGCRVHRDVSMFYKCFVAIWYPFEGPQQSKISPNISEQLRGVVLCRKKVMETTDHSGKPTVSNIGFQIFSWWFQMFFISTPNWGWFPTWLIFFRWVETTN